MYLTVWRVAPRLGLQEGGTRTCDFRSRVQPSFHVGKARLHRLHVKVLFALTWLHSREVGGRFPADSETKSACRNPRLGPEKHVSGMPTNSSKRQVQLQKEAPAGS